MIRPDGSHPGNLAVLLRSEFRAVQDRIASVGIIRGSHDVDPNLCPPDELLIIRRLLTDEIPFHSDRQGASRGESSGFGIDVQDPFVRSDGQRMRLSRNQPEVCRPPTGLLMPVRILCGLERAIGSFQRLVGHQQ